MRKWKMHSVCVAMRKWPVSDLYPGGGGGLVDNVVPGHEQDTQCSMDHLAG